MNLDGLFTRTTVTFNSSKRDSLSINNYEVGGRGLERVSYILDLVRGVTKSNEGAEVKSENNFPAGAGIASSAAAFAALALSASKAAGLNLSESELSRLARRGSGSASRSIPAGFVEWQMGNGEEDSFAFSIAPQIIGSGGLHCHCQRGTKKNRLYRRPCHCRDKSVAKCASGRCALCNGLVPAMAWPSVEPVFFCPALTMAMQSTRSNDLRRDGKCK